MLGCVRSATLLQVVNKGEVTALERVLTTSRFLNEGKKAVC